MLAKSTVCLSDINNPRAFLARDTVDLVATILAKTFWDTYPISRVFMEFAAYRQYTVLNKPLQRFRPHTPPIRGEGD